MVVKREEAVFPPEEFRSGPAAGALWWGVLAGPISFALNEVLSYAIVQHSCSTAHHGWLEFYTVLGVLLAIWGFISAQSCYSRIPKSISTEEGNTYSRARWMAIYGMAGSLAFVVLNIAVSIPKWAMSPCDQ
jgi:hypothetical protein